MKPTFKKAISVDVTGGAERAAGRASRFKAAGGALLMLVLLFCSPLCPVASGEPGEKPEIGIGISKDAYWYRPDWAVRISVTLENKGQQPVEGVSLRLKVHARNTSRSDLDDCLAGKPKKSYRLIRTFDRDKTLMPGQNSFQIEMGLEDYSLADGVYPLTVEAVKSQEVLASALSQLVVISDSESEDRLPLKLSVVMDLLEPFHRNAQGVFRDDGLAKECDPAGTEPGWYAALLAQVEQWENLHITFSLSPALLEEMAVMSGGFTMKERGGTRQVPASADECVNVRGVIDTFRLMAQQPRFQFLPAPYASPNIETLWGLGWYADVKEHLARGRETLEKNLESPLAGEYFMPPGLDLNSEIMDGLHGQIGKFLLLDPGLLERSREGRKLSAGATTVGAPVELESVEGKRSLGVFADGRLQTIISKVAASEDPHGVTQYLVSELANLYLEQPSGDRLCTLVWPGSWRPGKQVLGELMRAFSTAPWLQGVTFAEGIFLVPATEDVVLEIPKAPEGAAGAYFSRVAKAHNLLGVFGGLVFRNNLLLPLLERNLYYSESDVWRQWNRSSSGLEYAAAVESGVNGELAKVTLPALTDITLTSGKARVPVTVINGTGYRIKADLYCSSNGLEFPDGDRTAVTLAPKENVFEIKVNVKKQGRLRFSALLQSGDITIGRVDTTVRTGRISSFALAFIGGLLGVIVLIWVVRVLSRRKAGKHKKGQLEPVNGE